MIALMDWGEIGVSFAVSLLASLFVSVGLWTLLPRGVVLTRRVKTGTSPHHWLGNPSPPWEIANSSALPVRIISARVTGLQVFEETQAADTPMPWRDLPVDGGYGVTLWFDDEALEIARSDVDGGTPWNKIVIPPGDTLTAFVTLNTSLEIRYRRTGWLGVLERRALHVSGGA